MNDKYDGKPEHSAAGWSPYDSDYCPSMGRPLTSAEIEANRKRQSEDAMSKFEFGMLVEICDGSVERISNHGVVLSTDNYRCCVGLPNGEAYNVSVKHLKHRIPNHLHALVRAAEWMKQTVNVFNLSNNALRDYREHAATIAQWAERMPK